MALSHEPPDYPVMNLEVARRGRVAHAACDAETCSAKAYFDRRVVRLESESSTLRSSRNPTSLRTTWNIW